MLASLSTERHPHICVEFLLISPTGPVIAFLVLSHVNITPVKGSKPTVLEIGVFSICAEQEQPGQRQGKFPPH